MKQQLAALLLGAALLTGCGGSKPAAPTEEKPATEAAASAAMPESETESIPMRNFAAIKIGPYDVQPMFEEEIEDGHYNIKVTGGEFSAVRIWVGAEDAAGAMVAKTEVENNYQHGHVELPDPLPADAQLWIEIENAAGETFKGGTPLKMVP